MIHYFYSIIHFFIPSATLVSILCGNEGAEKDAELPEINYNLTKHHFKEHYRINNPYVISHR